MKLDGSCVSPEDGRFPICMQMRGDVTASLTSLTSMERVGRVGEGGRFMQIDDRKFDGGPR